MTYEEAIAELDELSLSVEMPSSTVEAIELAIEVLQKQVPMKAIEKDTENDFDFLCPICGNSVLDAITGEMECCCECDQRIDWSNEE